MSEDINEFLKCFDEAMIEHYKVETPKCHFTPMSYQASDDEEWFECNHCGHTESIGMMNRGLYR